MAELTIDPTTIRKALDEFVESYKPSDTPTQEVGYVATAGDGIAHVTGLPGCMANELLTFEDGTLGLAFNLDAREIGVVILGDFTGIEEGQEVRRTGEVLSVPVGDGYLGRVVDPLGNPIDGLGEIKTEGRRILEAQAPDVMHRHPVDEPIGRGQRQLIIGDRQTGKTAIAIDTIINQKRNWESGDPKKQVRCIYVAVGQKGSTIASVKQSLEEAGAMEYTTIVASPASPSDSTGCTTASTCSSSSTICRSRLRLTARFPCCCVVRRGVRLTRAMCSICTPVCSNVAPRFPMTSAAAR